MLGDFPASDCELSGVVTRKNNKPVFKNSNSKHMVSGGWGLMECRLVVVDYLVAWPSCSCKADFTLTQETRTNKEIPKLYSFQYFVNLVMRSMIKFE